jgi:hypothetical protein
LIVKAHLSKELSVTSSTIWPQEAPVAIVDSSPSHVQLFWAAAFLVSVPVFFQAPLVRAYPWHSLAITPIWLFGSLWLKRRSTVKVWGELGVGFTWTWLAGSLYWGWLRWEPYWHLPVEAIALPLALYYLWNQQNKVGSWFYLGSLLGTVVTDAYFYCVDLIPDWRQLMKVEATLATPVFQSAIAKIETPWGGSCALILAVTLVLIGVSSLRSQTIHRWAFGGAVLSTLLVDGLFWLAASH